MVERPIKKADRQPKGTDDNNSENSDSQPNQSSPKISKQVGDTPKESLRDTPFAERSAGKESRSDRADNKGKKYGNADAPSSGGNPALARGPKPVKPKPPVVVAETEPEEVSQESEA